MSKRSAKGAKPKPQAAPAGKRRKAGLTPRQEAFVAAYLVSLNATEAAREAGYSEKTAEQQGYRLLRNAQVAAAVQKGRDAAQRRADLTLDEIIRETSKIAFANMADYMRVGPDGDPVLDFSKLTRDQAAALVEVTVDDYIDGRGEDRRSVRRVRFKLADKLGALVSLGKHFGGFGSKVEVSGPGGAPLALAPLASLAADELASIRQILQRRAGVQSKDGGDGGNEAAD